MANSLSLGASHGGAGESILDTAISFLRAESGPDLFTVPVFNVGVTSQRLAVVARATQSMLSVFQPLEDVNPLTGGGNEAFRLALRNWRVSNAAIFGDSIHAALTISEALNDFEHVVDGNLMKTWAFNLLQTAAAAEGLAAHVETPNLPSFGDFKIVVIAIAVIAVAMVAK